jgi:hypothetical protein
MGQEVSTFSDMAVETAKKPFDSIIGSNSTQVENNAPKDTTSRIKVQVKTATQAPAQNAINQLKTMFKQKGIVIKQIASRREKTFSLFKSKNSKSEIESSANNDLIKVPIGNNITENAEKASDELSDILGTPSVEIPDTMNVTTKIEEMSMTESVYFPEYKKTIESLFGLIQDPYFKPPEKNLYFKTKDYDTLVGELLVSKVVILLIERNELLNDIDEKIILRMISDFDKLSNKDYQKYLIKKIRSFLDLLTFDTAGGSTAYLKKVYMFQVPDFSFQIDKIYDENNAKEKILASIFRQILFTENQNKMPVHLFPWPEFLLKLIIKGFEGLEFLYVSGGGCYSKASNYYYVRLQITRFKKILNRNLKANCIWVTDRLTGKVPNVANIFEIGDEEIVSDDNMVSENIMRRCNGDIRCRRLAHARAKLTRRGYDQNCLFNSTLLDKGIKKRRKGFFSFLKSDYSSPYKVGGNAKTRKINKVTMRQFGGNPSDKEILQMIEEAEMKKTEKGRNKLLEQEFHVFDSTKSAKSRGTITPLNALLGASPSFVSPISLSNNESKIETKVESRLEILDYNQIEGKRDLNKESSVFKNNLNESSYNDSIKKLVKGKYRPVKNINDIKKIFDVDGYLTMRRKIIGGLVATSVTLISVEAAMLGGAAGILAACGVTILSQLKEALELPRVLSFIEKDLKFLMDICSG